MKKTKATHLLLLIAAGVFGCSTAAHAQNADADIQYWDGGTSGTWDAGLTADWTNPQANPPYVTTPPGQSPGTTVYYNSNDRNLDSRPQFNSGGGTITVDDSNGDPTFGEMDFGGSGNWTITGGTIDSVDSNNSATVVYDSGSGNVTLSSTINIAPNPTNPSSYFTNASAGTTLTIGNLNISTIPQSGTYENGVSYTNQTTPSTFYQSNGTPYTVSGQTVVLYAVNGATIDFNGTYTTDAGLTGGMLIGNYDDSNSEGGTYVLSGNLDENTGGGKLMDFGSGHIILDTSNLGSSPIAYVNNQASVGSILTEGTQTISNTIYSQYTSNAEIGAGDGSTSTFSGQISAGSGDGTLDLHAGTGGTVTFSNNISGNNGATTKDGTGTVILSNATGNTWTTYIPDAFEMKAGTTVITNTLGDAFGNGAANGSVGSVFVQLDASATLAGTGSTAHLLNAMGATSVISPGLSNTIGTLTLAGGLVATSGLTMDFKLNGDGNDGSLPNQPGVNNDLLIVSSLTLSGTVTINLTAMDTLLTGPGNPYTLFVDDDARPIGTPTFDIVAPSGYALDTSYYGDGYHYQRGVFSVELVATPEPSTYGLMGLGLLALVGIGHWLRRGQSL
jgi:hypothetical protein